MTETEIFVQPSPKLMRMDESPVTSKTRSYMEFGIEKFVLDGNGFSGVLRHRISDFQVFEIAVDGTEVHLTTFDAPKACDGVNWDDDINAEIRTKFESQIRNYCIEKNFSEDLSLSIGELDKDTRTIIHKLIARISSEFQVRLHSKTVASCGENVIVVSKENTEKRHSWPKPGFPYVTCVLYKENYDTTEAMFKIAKDLRLNKISLFSYAGVKDKRAKTSQLLSCFKILPEKLCQANQAGSRIKLGNFTFTKKPLTLAAMKGNRFAIVIRKLNGDADTLNIVKVRSASLSSRGFINYFGMQRFGTCATSTDKVGLLLIQKKWSEAISVLLNPENTRKESIKAALLHYSNSKDPVEALKLSGNVRSIETQLLRGLAESDESDFFRVLSSVSRHNRTFYLHAYQSRIWNCVASFRLSLGLSLLIGDLVMTNGKKDPVYITASNINSFSIYDLVLPLPGCKVIYPKNESGDLYDSLFSMDGITRNNFNSSNRDYELCGTYRKLLIIPQEFRMNIVTYDNEDEDLILSDLDKINGRELDIKGSKYTALLIEFTLPPCSYATMAVRELMHTIEEPGLNLNET